MNTENNPSPKSSGLSTNPSSGQIDTAGLTMLGNNARYNFDKPDISILEAFPNRYPQRDYIIQFEHPEFTSLCPMTGQPDFGLIRLRYVPDERCMESKSFKIYMVSFRNQGTFMESLTNQIADDLVALLKPRRLTLEGIFNVRGGTAISVRVEHLDSSLDKERQEALKALW